MIQESNLKTIDEERDEFSINVSSLPYGVFAVYPTCGFLHQDGEKWVATSDDYEFSVVLPDYIKDRQSALAFLRHSHDQFRLGMEMGEKTKERQLPLPEGRSL